MLTLQVPFPPTLSSRLAQRLQDIAMKEKLRTDMTALMALTEKTDNDIRACLSTLQFFKSRGKYMRSVDIHKVNIGQKDATKSLKSIWDEMFQVYMIEDLVIISNLLSIYIQQLPY